MWANAAPLPENESPRPPAGCVKSEEDLVLWAQILLCLAAIGLVLAAADGVVRMAGSHKSYGNYLRILHADGDETLYAHMQYLFVKAGECVTAGQSLGTVGETGNATGPHLHFEILHRGLRYDPAEALQNAS